MTTWMVICLALEAASMFCVLNWLEGYRKWVLGFLFALSVLASFHAGHVLTLAPH